MKQPPKWLYKVVQFMQGRYGIMDSLNKFLISCGLILIFLTIFIHAGWLNLLGLLFLIATYWRVFSRKIYQRARENGKFQQWTAWLTKPISRRYQEWQQRKQYRFFTCKNCHQRIRIPKGKGKIQITCPTCRHQFRART
ncbi:MULTISPECIES: hypothetical protein [Pediococcus]|uniref:Zn-finger containing protein n=1 Tax=Pediococcus parvulus TaxID=54062 RepID=A0AAP5TAK0_9LACO|nr:MULTISPECIES: hypothetical protein [Pediococcus]MCT3027022.1 hypothetical protein [Pediococcus parvulus]MCT3029796.1 hypothetical protein [Pediococcus parvulus]MCT3034024.1 hypothetical protein [Pediococcus parvulus]MDN5575872.1 zinc-ribbon domain-containing protein [Pediococcus sp.]MDV7694244.1 hypothetical protein [Pediococcus parvulus]